MSDRRRELTEEERARLRRLTERLDRDLARLSGAPDWHAIGRRWQERARRLLLALAGAVERRCCHGWGGLPPAATVVLRPPYGRAEAFGTAPICSRYAYGSPPRGGLKQENARWRGTTAAADRRQRLGRGQRSGRYRCSNPEALRRKAGAAVGEHTGHSEGKGVERLLQDGNGAGFGLVVLHRHVGEA